MTDMHLAPLMTDTHSAPLMTDDWGISVCLYQTRQW